MWTACVDFAGSTGIAGFFAEMGWGNVAMISRRVLPALPGHQAQVRTAAAVHHRLRHAASPTCRVRTCYHSELFAGGQCPLGIASWQDAGLLDYTLPGCEAGASIPCLIFVGVGAMTDFGPLIANPKSFMLGAARAAAVFS